MSGNYDSYRPSNRTSNDNYPSSQEYPPGASRSDYQSASYLPPYGPPPGLSGGSQPMYRFGSNAPPRAQGGYRDLDDPSRGQNEFSFRVNDGAPRFPEQQPTNPSQRRVYNRAPRNQQGRGPYRPRGRPIKPPTSDRPLLRFERGQTPEQLAGMEGAEGERKFLDVGDLSDSEERSLDESESEDYEPPVDADLLEPPKNKRRKAIKEEAPAPKWSNPDPYTVLPPVDDSERKKRDVVKLIRKARVAAESDKDKPTQAAPGDDFISFGFDDDDDDEDEESEDENSMRGSGMPGAPSGPRGSTMNGSSQAPFSHLRNLHGIPAKPAVDLSVSTSLPDRPPLPAGPHLVSTSAVVEVASSVAEKLVIGGKRKKDDETAVKLVPPKSTKGRGRFLGGYVLPEWTNVKDANPLPWLVEDHSLTINSGFRLHKEICDFYEFVRPRHFEERMRRSLLDRLQQFISTWDKNCTVHSFGSFAAGLYLPNGDMDVVVVSKRFMEYGTPTVAQTNSKMYQLSSRLENSGLALPGSMQVITKARVPLIKYTDKVTRLMVDMSFENDTGIIANGTFQEWKAQYPAMPILVTIIKQFLLMRGLSNVAVGGLGGFSVTCLVTSMLQNMPRIQLGEFSPENHLGEMLLEFLDLYGNTFDLDRVGISMNPPGFFDKRALGGTGKNARLCIVDPNKVGNDISGGSREVPIIFKRFSAAREEILQAIQNPKRKSLLDWLLGGNYNEFLWQRWHLRQLYEKTYGPVEPEYVDVQINIDVASASHANIRLMPINAQSDTLSAKIFGSNSEIALDNSPPAFREDKTHLNNHERAAKFSGNYPRVAAWAGDQMVSGLSEYTKHRILLAWANSNDGSISFDEAARYVTADTRSLLIAQEIAKARAESKDKAIAARKLSEQARVLNDGEDMDQSEQSTPVTSSKVSKTSRTREKEKRAREAKANRRRQIAAKLVLDEPHIASWAGVRPLSSLRQQTADRIMNVWRQSNGGTIPYTAFPKSMAMQSDGFPGGVSAAAGSTKVVKPGDTATHPLEISSPETVQLEAGDAQLPPSQQRPHNVTEHLLPALHMDLDGAADGIEEGHSYTRASIKAEDSQQDWALARAEKSAKKRARSESPEKFNALPKKRVRGRPRSLKERAEYFKDDFPHIPDVPDELTLNQERDLRVLHGLPNEYLLNARSAAFIAEFPHIPNVSARLTAAQERMLRAFHGLPALPDNSQSCLRSGTEFKSDVFPSLTAKTAENAEVTNQRERERGAGKHIQASRTQRERPLRKKRGKPGSQEQKAEYLIKTSQKLQEQSDEFKRHFPWIQGVPKELTHKMEESLRKRNGLPERKSLKNRAHTQATADLQTSNSQGHFPFKLDLPLRSLSLQAAAASAVKTEQPPSHAGPDFEALVKQEHFEAGSVSEQSQSHTLPSLSLDDSSGETMDSEPFESVSFSQGQDYAELPLSEGNIWNQGFSDWKASFQQQ